MFCPVCGKQVPDDSKFCEGCGANLAAPPDTDEMADPQLEVLNGPQPPEAEAPVQPEEVPPAPQVPPVYAAPPAAASAYAPPPYAAPQPQAYAPVPQPQYVQPMPSQVNELTRPVGIVGFIGMIILLLIPFVNFIMLLVWAFSSNANLNKKNLARAILILYIIFYVVLIVLMIVFRTLILENMEQLKDILSQYVISFQ